MMAGPFSTVGKVRPLWSQFLDIIRTWRQDFTREVATWQVQEWFLANVVVLIIGAFLLKVSVSRKHYYFQLLNMLQDAVYQIRIV